MVGAVLLLLPLSDPLLLLQACNLCWPKGYCHPAHHILAHLVHHNLAHLVHHSLAHQLHHLARLGQRLGAHLVGQVGWM